MNAANHMISQKVMMACMWWVITGSVSTPVLLMEISYITLISNPPQSNYMVLWVSVLIVVVIFLSLRLGLVLRVCMYSHPVVSMYIASFDLSMRCPVGIVIDEDGFVYVCNYSSNGKFFCILRWH